MRRDLFNIISLRCPCCGTSLAVLKVHSMKGEDIEGALLQCKSMRCRSVFPVISSIPVLITNIQAYIPSQSRLLSRLTDGSLQDPFIADLERHCGVSITSLERASEETLKAQKMSYAYYLLRQYPLHVHPCDELADLITMRRDSALYGIDEILKEIPPVDGVAVDLGCAAGRFVFEFASVAEFSIGLDYSFDLVDSASHLWREGRLSFHLPGESGVFEDAEIQFDTGGRDRKTDFIVADAASPVFPENSIALVSAMNFLTELPKPSGALTTMDAMLKPGGYLLFGSTYNWMTRLEDELLLRLRRSYNSYEELFRAIITGDEASFPLSRRYSIVDEKNIPFYAYFERRRYMMYLMDFLLCRKLQDE